MKALVYQGPGKQSKEEIPVPKIKDPNDAIIKLTATTICGTDLHILKGDVPAIPHGRVLGHEGIGYIQEVGSAVKNFKVDDKVLIGCITSCGHCVYCKRNLQSHCKDGGWILGNVVDGTQAEYVRIPHADFSLHNIKHFEGKVKDEALLMCSDTLPTGNEIGAINGKINEGDIVAIVGAGSVGMCVLLAAKTYKPSLVIMIDPDEERLKVAQETFGADVGINPAKSDVRDEIAKLVTATNKGERAGFEPGVDVAIECVGIKATFDTCQKIIAPGGRIANVGVHGTSVDLQIQDLWSANITIATELVNANTTPDLLSKISKKQLDPSKLVTHRFKFDQVLDAYETFKKSAENKCIKVLIEFDDA